MILHASASRVASARPRTVSRVRRRVWQPLPPGNDYPKRRLWYGEHVQYGGITSVLRVAERFLSGEIARLI